MSKRSPSSGIPCPSRPLTWSGPPAILLCENMRKTEGNTMLDDVKRFDMQKSPMRQHLLPVAWALSAGPLISHKNKLTKVRMEEAVRLLQETEEKSYVIAGMVGYEEPTYFSYVFKKQYGVSPSKYKSGKE